jgi:hypothetical protein
MDLSAMASQHGVGTLIGVLGTMLIKEMAGRFFRRSEKLEDKWDEIHEDLIRQLLDQVSGVRSALEVMGERFVHHQASATETKTRVEDHGSRISALEVEQAAMKARMNYIGEAKDD